MKIAFHTSHLKTRFFHAIASRLERHGHEVYWVSTSRRVSTWLTDQGVPQSHILNLYEYGTEWSKKSSLNSRDELELRELEQQSGITINNVILMDRHLRRKPYAYSRAYLYVAQREIKRFLTENAIRVVFLEVAFASEVLITMICSQIDCRSYFPASARFPSGRSCFFGSHTESNVAYMREPDEKDREEAEKFYEYFVNNSPRPAYFDTDFRGPSIHVNWIRKLFLHVWLKLTDPYNETCPSPMQLVKARLSEIWNSRRLARMIGFETLQLPLKRPYVLYGLHQQPEASIDIVGAYFSNQVELLRSLARSLPTTHDLYVKEHRVCVGERPIEFYKTVEQIPGVKLIHPFADSHELIRHADLVFTVSGTMAYEAALYRIPAMTVVPMFFGSILAVNGISPYQEQLGEIFECLCHRERIGGALPDREKIIEFLAWMQAQSYEALISDPGTNPRCMEPANLDNVARAAEKLLRTQVTLIPSSVP